MMSVMGGTLLSFYSSSGTLQLFRWPVLPSEDLHVFSTSWFAEHRLCFRDSCRFWNASGRNLLQSDPLVSEQPALPADAAAISGKTSISADDPVARNHNGNRVCGIGQANRTDGFRAAQLSRQRPIT